MTVLDWLLDADPSIRWQVLRDLAGASADDVAAERARVAREGWGARLLDLQGADGCWAGGALFPAGTTSIEHGQPWTATEPTLTMLRTFGADPADARVREAVGKVKDNCLWEYDDLPFFAGEVEPCINGRTVALAVYFGESADALVARLTGEQLADGGWNCEAENGSVRSSFDTTINVLDGLLAYEQATGGTPESVAARRRAEEYLLERHLFRRLRTGEAIKPEYLQLSFPPRWHYDVLRALDHFRAAGEAPDPRVEEAVEVVRAKRQPDGRWPLENVYRGDTYFPVDEGVGRPSRWNTLRAQRVLDWYGKN